MKRQHLVVGGLIVVGMAVAFIVGYAVSLWPTATDPLKAALINGAVALLTFSGGIALVLHQLNVQTDNLNRQIQNQAQSALGSSRYGERLKLQKDVYEAADAVIAEAEKALDALRACMQSTVNDIALVRQFGGEPIAIKGAMEQAREACAAASNLMNQLPIKWEIIQPGIRALQAPIRAARGALDHEYFEFMKLLIGVLPEQKGSGHKMGANDMTGERLKEIRTQAEKLLLAITTLQFFSHDLRIEFQNLLQDVFERRASYRKPSDEVPIVLRADRPEDFSDYVNEHRSQRDARIAEYRAL